MPRKAAPVSVIPVREVLNTESTKPPHKRHVIHPSERGVGTAIYSDAAWAPTFTQPRVKKHDKGLDTWANTALVLVERAKRAAQTYGKKDFNALYRLVLSAGIAFDKAFPTVQAPSTNNLIVNLFGSLGGETTRAILEPSRPTLVDTTIVVDSLPNEVALPSSLPVGELPQGSERDTTKAQPLDPTT